MKNILLLFTLSSLCLTAQNIVFSPEQQANWQIEVATPIPASQLPLGQFMTQIVTPPTLLHTLSLPFEANVKKLYVANYQSVTKGQILAEVTGTEWIATQQKAIADAIEFKHHKHIAERQNMLCKEEIIPQKECVSANAELKADIIKVSASKALLQSYGASETMINSLFKNLTLSPTIKLHAPINGRIIQLNASIGQSTNPSKALFLIQEKGDLWLESEIEAQRTRNLKEGQKVSISLQNHTFETTVLQLSPVVNPQNQTRQVRFEIPWREDIFAGLRGNAEITLLHPSIKIPKKAVIKVKKSQMVFVQNTQGYDALAIEILAEDDNAYFVKALPQLSHKIAISGLAILKNMLGENEDAK